MPKKNGKIIKCKICGKEFYVKLSRAMFVKFCSQKCYGEFLKGHIPWNKGKHWSEEVKKKMSKSRKGKRTGKDNPFYGKTHTEENKRKIIKANKGKKHSEETKKKMSLAQRGEKSHNWRGGISFEPYPTEWTDDLKESIRKRDGYICQICGIHQNEFGGFYKKLDIHHIDYNKDNLDPKNLISLCRQCHFKTNQNREYWIEYFNKLTLNLFQV